jgi:hypothetical protein
LAEDKPYRFLLRMPPRLGERLRQAAERSERSLNREIVERLEASLHRQPGRPLRHLLGGGSMSGRRRLAIAAALPVLLGAAALVAALTLSRETTPAPGFATGELPAAFAQHVAALRAAPGSGELEGPGSWQQQDDFIRAYPGNDVAYTSIAAARSGWAKLKNKPFPKGKGQKGTWVSVGPSSALNDISPLRTRTGYLSGKGEVAGRTPAIAIAPTCVNGNCRLWIGTAGGGVWRTDDALANDVQWRFLSASFELNAIGSITLDPNDPTGNTLWVGTGEANAAGSAAAGVGLYKSTDGGDTWSGPIGQGVFKGRAVGSMAIQPGSSNVVYAATTRAVRGIPATTAGATSLIPGAPKWGLYKSTDGGATWTFIHNGSTDESVCTGDANESVGGTPCSPRGVRRVALDPNDPDVLYAGSYARGVWRSPNAGADWTQIFAPLENGPATGNTERPEFALADLGATTRMYLQIGTTLGGADSTFWITQDAAGAAAFTKKSSPNLADQGWAVHALCANQDPAIQIGQCWYDQIVYTPKGHPDIVYVGGVFEYGEQIANHRGVVMSEDGGTTWYDMTEDATDDVHPQQLHPDQHALVTLPDDPYVFFESSDGGVWRSASGLVDRSAVCASRRLNAPQRARCEQMLTKVPAKLEPLNDGLKTLQFFTVTASPFNAGLLQGGTQDNATWQTYGDPDRWVSTFISDGGHNGFDAALPEFRFQMFFQPQAFVSFSNGADTDWNWISDRFFDGVEPLPFYPSFISDPVQSGWMFAGTGHVFRTKTHGRGSMTIDELRARCNFLTGTFRPPNTCGDWVPLGDATAAGMLSNASFGDRAGGNVSVVERTRADSSTLWAGTSTGRLFVSKNVGAEPATAVVFDRIDTDTAIDPNRFVSGIFVHPTNPNRAYVSYSGYSAATPAAPGHVFQIDYDPATGTAAWTRLDPDGAGIPDTPVTDVAFDVVTGDLYATTDFGVTKLPGGTGSWVEAAGGLPNVMVSSLTMVADSRILYAATHGFGVWRLDLEK